MDKGAARNNALDGLRAYAAALVVASHVGVLHQGGLANNIFFALSGFLAAMPFREGGERRFLSVRYIGNYYLGRFLRIFPVFWVVISLVYFITGRFFTSMTDFIRNAFFVESYGHLWFLQQQVLMYACLPMIMICLSGIKYLTRKLKNAEAEGDLICALFLAILSCFCNRYLTSSVFYLYGNNAHQRFHIHLFLIGMSAAYFYRGLGYFRVKLLETKGALLLADFLSGFLILGCILSSKSVLRHMDASLGDYLIGWRQPVLCAVLTCCEIILLLLNPGGFTSRFLGCKLLSKIGEVSFTIYLVHFFLISYTKVGNPYKHFVFLFGLSVCIAWVLHILVEKPSVIFAKTKSFNKVKQYFEELS